MRDLPHTGHAFFQTYGRFTPIQRLTIPAILGGNDTLVISCTASGKTEATCAPLLELNLEREGPWTILYISPTRALINDLHSRLIGFSQRLNVSLKRRTGDHRDDLRRIPNILLTTPESFDSMLCRNGRDDPLGHDLAHVVAVVLDEIHLLHGTARGEQTRWLLERLRRLREFSLRKEWTRDAGFQTVALSATVPDPDSICRDHFPGHVRVVESPERRSIETVDLSSTDTEVESALPGYIEMLDRDEKILVFSNSRKRVDELSRHLSERTAPMGYRVYAHHGSLGKDERENAEDAMKNGERVLLCATSSMEIGVDIGDIDLVVLDGPPSDVSSLLQRIGRGNRRTDGTRVMACSGTVADLLLQNAMIDAARDGWLGEGSIGPCYSAVRQQIASYIFQSPTKRRNERSLHALFDDARIDRGMFDAILRTMIENEELRWVGESIGLGDHWWMMASRRGNIHSTIEGSGGMNIVSIEDGRRIGSDVIYEGGGTIGVGGKALQVCKRENMTLEVRNLLDNESLQGQWRYASSRFSIHSSQPMALRRYLGIPEGTWPLVGDAGGTYAFHLGGGTRRAVLSLLIHLYVEKGERIRVNEWYIQFPGSIDKKPPWLDRFNVGLMKMTLDTDESIVREMEEILGRPFSNRRLPPEVRADEVVGWMDIEAEAGHIKESSWEFLSEKAVEDALKHFIRTG